MKSDVGVLRNTSAFVKSSGSLSRPSGMRVSMFLWTSWLRFFLVYIHLVRFEWKTVGSIVLMLMLCGFYLHVIACVSPLILDLEVQYAL